MESTLIPRVNINDVLFGRGTAINAHPGNRQFRSLVNLHKDDFLKAQCNRDKNERQSIALLIFTAIQSMQPPGRFLVEVQSDNATESNTDNNNESVGSSYHVHPILEKKTWKCVDREKALDKILKRLQERDKEERAVSMPLTQTLVIERGMFNSHSIMLPKPQSPEVMIGDALQFNAYSQNRWVNQTVDAFRLQSQLNHQWQHSNSNSLRLNTIFTEEELISEASSIRDGAATETTSKNGNALCQYLEGSGLDFIDDSLLQATTPQVDQDFIQHLSEYSLRQWIVASNPVVSFDTVTSTPSSTDRTQYIKSALLIALKLAECFLEAEKDERNGHGNPIPLASIATENVLLRSRKGGQHAGVGESSEAQETIEFVWIMSLVGDDPATGTVMARLFAVGKILIRHGQGRVACLSHGVNGFHQHQ
ncbi:hypothetical protein ACHAWU_000338 [Discostella pseudostelligera]|uniref:DUF6824 domain-containing protein n=1 Tax=Discostella pseudostelligera TaxID=259834 RepID=A0ABD3M9C9_9STRA